jgi:hypothetical protein
MTEEEQLENVRRHPHSIKSIPNPSLAAQKAALTYSGTLLHSVNNLDPRVFDDPKVIHSLDLSLLFALKHGYIRSLEDMITTIRSTGASWDTLDKVENAMTRENIQENIQTLTEDLGNLAELRLGKLGGLLKQQMYRSSRSRDFVGAVEKKFSPYSLFGPNSEIITVPAVKRDLAKTIKKQFASDSEIIAATVYLNNNPVIFMITDATNLRGGTRENSVAYDFTLYSEDFQEIMKAKTYNYRDFPATSVRQSQEKDYSYRVSHNEDFPIVTKSYAGKLVDTHDLNRLLDTAETIAKNQNIIMSLKFVKKDRERIDIRNRRAWITRGDILVTGEELKVRLAKYKNSKRPTAETIEDFIKMSISGTADVIRFDDVAYLVAKSSYVKIDPVLLLQGTPFSVTYRGADPGDYRSVDVKFYFDRTSNMIVPYVASWYIDQRRQEEILDPAAYLKINLKISTVEKREVLKKILENLKAGRIDAVKSYIRAVKKMKVDWPEVAQIEAVLEKSKINESSQDINSMSEEEQIAAIQRDSLAFKRITNPSERVQIAAVQKDTGSLVYIYKAGLIPSENVQLAAVRKSPVSIQFIKNPALTTQATAIQFADTFSIMTVIKYIKNIELFDNADLKRKILDIIERRFMMNPDYNRYAMEIVNALHKHNVTWPELDNLDTLRDRALANFSTADSKTQLSLLIDTPTTALLNASSTEVQIEYLKKNPDNIVSIQNPHPDLFSSAGVKQAVIKDILGLLKKMGSTGEEEYDVTDFNSMRYSVINRYIEYLNKHNAGWPELDRINSVIKSDVLNKKSITESSESIDTMSEEEQIEEVLRNPDNIQYIENPSERVQLAAVEGDGLVLEFINNPSERVKLAAVKENAWVIVDMPDPSVELILAAIQSNSEVIKYIQPNQELFSSEEAKRIILRILLTELNTGNEVDSIISYLRQKQVKWPELEKIEAVASKKSITESRQINQMSEEDQIREVHYQPFKIRFIQSPSERVQLAAVNQDGYALVYIPNPSFQVQKAAIIDDKWVAMNNKASEELFDDPEVKQSVLRKMLLDLKSGDVYLAEYVEVLRSRNVKWPELDTIESALHKKQITERTRNVNK